MNLNYYIIPIILIIIFSYSLLKKHDAYSSFIKGSKEAMISSFKIAPYLLSMYIAIKVLNASNILTDLIKFKDFPTSFILQGIFKPFSYNASNAFMLNIFEQYGVDSKIALYSSVLQASKDTTIYIMTMYFSAIGIVHYRYAMKLGLICDLFCFILCLLLFLYF